MTYKSPPDETPEDSELFTSLLRLAQTNDPGESIPAEVVKRGIASSDILINGLVFDIMHSPHLYKRIAPPLTLDDFQKLHIKYLPSCIRERRDSEWIQSPYLAAHAVARWFLHLWEDHEANQNLLTDWKNTLAQLVIEGGNEMRDRVVCGVLEHLFSNQFIRKFFLIGKTIQYCVTPTTMRLTWFHDAHTQLLRALSYTKCVKTILNVSKRYVFCETGKIAALKDIPVAVRKSILKSTTKSIEAVRKVIGVS